MTDAAVVGRLLDEYHERSARPSVRVLSGSEHQASLAYLVTLADGTANVIRAYRADEPVPGHGRDLAGDTAGNVADWLTGRARTLALLADAAYPAPRPVRTRTGELIGVAGQWLSWATTHVAGSLTEPTLDQIRMVGAALGHLHSVAVLRGGDRIGDGPAGLAPSHPAAAVPASLARLDRVDGLLPGAWRPLHAEVRAVLAGIAVAARSLPESIVHGVVRARNVVQSSPSGVTFVDWEDGGRGLAVTDLGSALLDCQPGAGLADDPASRRPIQLSPERTGAVAEGYARVRALSPAERRLLPAAVKFATAVACSVHFDRALSEGVKGPTMDARLAWLETRLAIAGEVTSLARDCLLQARGCGSGGLSRDRTVDLPGVSRML